MFNGCNFNPLFLSLLPCTTHFHSHFWVCGIVGAALRVRVVVVQCWIRFGEAGQCKVTKSYAVVHIYPTLCGDWLEAEVWQSEWREKWKRGGGWWWSQNKQYIRTTACFFTPTFSLSTLWTGGQAKCIKDLEEILSANHAIFSLRPRVGIRVI